VTLVRSPTLTKFAPVGLGDWVFMFSKSVRAEPVEALPCSEVKCGPSTSSGRTERDDA